MTEDNFCVSINFRITGTLDIEEECFNFSIKGREVYIYSRDEGKLISESEWLCARSYGFSIEKEAIEFGAILKFTLIFSPVFCGLGIDVGFDEPRFKFDGCGVSSFVSGDDSINFIDSVHGLSIINLKNEDDVYIYRELKFESIVSRDRFHRSIIYAHQNYDQIHKAFGGNLCMSLKFFSLALMQRESWAKFILCITSIEALADRIDLSESRRAALDRAIISIKSSDIDEFEKSGIISQLKNLKKESIGSACSRLVERFLEKEDVKFFKKIYNHRSSFIHGSKIISDDDLFTLSNNLVSLARLLIIRKMEVLNEVSDFNLLIGNFDDFL